MLHLNLLFVYMHTCVHIRHGTCMKIREQLVEIYSLLQACETQGPKSGPQAWCQVPFPSIASFSTMVPFYISDLSILGKGKINRGREHSQGLITSTSTSILSTLVCYHLYLPYTVIMVLKSVPIYLVSSEFVI